MRLDKFLIESQVGLKKKARELILSGKVSVNGIVEIKPSRDVDEFTDDIICLEKSIHYSGKIYYMFNKPAGCITARTDKFEKTIFDYFQHINTEGLFPVGRLDKETEGLIIVTNDGEFNHRLMDPEAHVSKKYFFWAFGVLNEDKIHQIETGIDINQDGRLTRPAQIFVENVGTYEEFKSKMIITKPESLRKKSNHMKVFSGCVVITEGRKHQVRRMLRGVGCNIIYLRRIAIGNLVIDESLNKGEFKKLTQEEIIKIF